MARRPRVPGMVPVPIRNEDQAWELLELLQSSGFSDDTMLPSITRWPKFHFKFWIEGSSLVLTPPVMQAMLDFQTSVNRAFMLVLEETAGLKGLSEEERREFEIVFTITKGSTDLSFNAQELIEKFMEKAVGKLTGKQITIIVLAFAVLFVGYSCFNAYLENQKDVAKAEASSDQLKAVLASHKFADETDLKRMKILAEALSVARNGPALMEASDESKKSVVKAASKVQNTKIGSNHLPPEVAQRMARNARTTPETKTVTAQYDVLRVDTDVADGFRVRLQNSKTGERVFASVRDRLISLNDRELLQEGEWEKKPIIARVRETRRRGALVSAHIENVVSVVNGKRSTLKNADIAQVKISRSD